jgi:hypothetical protein
MMSTHREDYASASEWLETLRQDYLWQRQLQNLESSDDINNCRNDAEQMIGNGLTSQLWKILQPDVQSVVKEVWEMSELTLPKLRLQTIGMLSIAWLEQQKKVSLQMQEATIPEVLEKSALWEQLRDAGLVDESGQPTVSRPEAAMMADMLAERLNIAGKWKLFEQLWHRNNMRNDYNKALDQKKSLVFQEKLKKILG